MQGYLTINARIEQAMQSPGWKRGVVRARRQFADEDRARAMYRDMLGDWYGANALHAHADQHEEIIESAMLALKEGRKQ